ncbi:MAG: LPD7 domain-containing protein [Rhodospirillaceae bacterium]
MTVVRGVQRGNAGQLADYLTSDPTAELGQVRGVVATSAHEALAELSLLAAGTQCRSELFHCSINPNPADPTWTPAQYERAWEVFEREHGLTGHAFAEVYHRDEGRLHAHRAYAVVADGKAAKLSWSRTVNEKIGRLLEHEFGHEFVPGPNQPRVLIWLERSREPDQRAAAAAMRAAGLHQGPERDQAREKGWEKEQAKRTAISVAEVITAAAEAWRAAGGARYQAELRERGLVLAQGDGLVLVDRAEGVHPAGRRLFAGLTKGEAGREKTHQDQAAAIAAACQGQDIPSLAQARAQIRQEQRLAGLALPTADSMRQQHGDENGKAKTSGRKRAATAQEQDARSNRREPPPRARHNLQDLQALELVSFGQPAQVLLQGDVHHSLGSEPSGPHSVRSEFLGDTAMTTQTMTDDQAVRASHLREHAERALQRGDEKGAITIYREAADLGDAASIEDHDRLTLESAKTVSDLLVVYDPVTRFGAMDQAAGMEHLPAADRAAAEAHRLAAAREIMASSRLRERAAEQGIGERVYSLAPRPENRTADEARERAFDYKAAQDHELAIHQFREAAAAGDAESMYELGQYHELGVEVAQDLAEAGRLYQAAADAGFPEASNALDALAKRRPQEQTAQPGEKQEPVRLDTKRAPETKDQWQARKAYDELNALPTDRLAAIAAGRDRGKDHRLWAWRWTHTSVEMREALQQKLATAGHQQQQQPPAEKSGQDHQTPRPASAPVEKAAPNREAWINDTIAEWKQLSAIAQRTPEQDAQKDYCADIIWSTIDTDRLKKEFPNVKDQSEVIAGWERRTLPEELWGKTDWKLQEQPKQATAPNCTGPKNAQSPEERAEAYRGLKSPLISSVEIHGSAVHATLRGGQSIVDNGRSLTLNGPGDQQAARTMIDMSYARGWKSLHLSGPLPMKLAMARACVETGIEVQNPELARDVARMKQELEVTAKMARAPHAQQRTAEKTAGPQPPKQAADQAAPRPAEPTKQQQPEPKPEPKTAAHERIEQHFGRPFDQALTRGALTADPTPVGGIEVGFRGGATVTHDLEGAVHHGVLTEDRAQLMAEMMKAAGDTAIRVTGSQASKELMARAAFKAGLVVENVEMRDFMAQLAREHAQAQQREAEVAAMRPASPRPAQREQQRPETSAAALRSLELGKALRELAFATTPVDRFLAAERLVEISTDKQMYDISTKARLEAAIAILDQGEHTVQAEIFERADAIVEEHEDSLAYGPAESEAYGHNHEEEHER